MKTFPLAVALVIVLLAGLVHGLFTGRWIPSKDLEQAAQRVADVPLNVGDWQGEATTIDAKQLEMAGILAYRSATYVRRGGRSNDPLQLLLVCGDPRNIAVHTPDVCYAGNGYGLVGETQKHTVKLDGGGSATFESGVFRRDEGGVPTYLRVLWTFTTDGNWSAPDEARLAFPRYNHRFLYKMYIIHRVAKPDEPLNADPSNDFIKQLLPELKKALFPPPAQA
jgi:hypothetical protein